MIDGPSRKYLVIGATGHVGSKVAILLAEKGHDVTAMVRKDGATILDPHRGVIHYVTGDLADADSIRAAVTGMDVVISTANGVTPIRKSDNARSVNDLAVRMIGLCEEAGVRRFVQSSVPPYKEEEKVPELRGKRMIEERLSRSLMQSIIIRNPAFMDVFLVMGGFGQAADKSAHATTKRGYGLSRMWGALTGNLVEGWGIFLAPGGADHGTPTIATRDVAEMMVGGALYNGSNNLLIEAGGPQWLTWREIAQIVAEKIGRKRIRVLPIPAWTARLNQFLARPFFEPAANTFALMSFVASYQPHWDSAAVVKQFGLPQQMTVRDYLNVNYAPKHDDRKKSHIDRFSQMENRIPPPVVVLILGLLMAGLSRIGPRVAWLGSSRLDVAIFVTAIGFIVLASAFFRFRRVGTTIDPVQLQRASTLVTSGIFRLSRNPMYLGFTLILLGWSIFLSSLWAFIGPILFVALTTRFQIIPEERVMADKFGDEYTAYRKLVRRWI